MSFPQDIAGNIRVLRILKDVIGIVNSRHSQYQPVRLQSRGRREIVTDLIIFFWKKSKREHVSALSKIKASRARKNGPYPLHMWTGNRPGRNEAMLPPPVGSAVLIIRFLACNLCLTVMYFHGFIEEWTLTAYR